MGENSNAFDTYNPWVENWKALQEMYKDLKAEWPANLTEKEAIRDFVRTALNAEVTEHKENGKSSEFKYSGEWIKGVGKVETYGDGVEISAEFSACGSSAKEVVRKIARGISSYLKEIEGLGAFLAGGTPDKTPSAESEIELNNSASGSYRTDLVLEHGTYAVLVHVGAEKEGDGIYRGKFKIQIRKKYSDFLTNTKFEMGFEDLRKIADKLDLNYFNFKY